MSNRARYNDSMETINKKHDYEAQRLLKDSKCLTKDKREELDKYIRANCCGPPLFFSHGRDLHVPPLEPCARSGGGRGRGRGEAG